MRNEKRRKKSNWWRGFLNKKEIAARPDQLASLRRSRPCWKEIDNSIFYTTRFCMLVSAVLLSSSQALCWQHEAKRMYIRTQEREREEKSDVGVSWRIGSSRTARPKEWASNNETIVWASKHRERERTNGHIGRRRQRWRRRRRRCVYANNSSNSPPSSSILLPLKRRLLCSLPFV